ncbi:MAG: thrombospondin type 3 repeat-containing protein [Alphaproteobacteria bacterium]|nr:thrombospondin type 3 repeat-containing protein [Alphaproteobacteria bacterium]
MRAHVPLLLLMACSPETSPEDLPHFDPPGDSTLSEPVVRVINLDEVDRICYTVDGTAPEWGACEQLLEGGEREVLLPCGFVVLSIAWDEGRKTDQANYLVEAEDCAEQEGPVVLWANDELVRAFVQMKDSLQCQMNGCENPSGTGHWSTDCDTGTVNWDVSLSGLRAISEFTYQSCTTSAEIEVHDYATDPWYQDEAATLPLTVTLTLDGVITQDVDFGGNGSEMGAVEVTGDFLGRVESRIEIADEARAGGGFAAGCTEDPLDDEICAPAGAMILYDFPDWSCHDGICPEPGDAPPENDADGDGVDDAEDNCVDEANPLQEDLDEDGLGDACDEVTDFSLIWFKHGQRCLVLGAEDVESTSECNPNDRRQQWVVSETDGHLRFESRATPDVCMGWSGWGWGPWTVTGVACSETDESQQWLLEDYDQGGFDEAWPTRLHNRAENFCIYTDNTGLVYGTVANCGLAGSDAGRKVGIYEGGDFELEPLRP